MATFNLGNVPSPIQQAVRLAQLREIQNPQLALDRDIQKAIQLQQLQQQSPENQLALQLRQAQLNSALQQQAFQQQQQPLEAQRQEYLVEQLKQQLDPNYQAQQNAAKISFDVDRARQLAQVERAIPFQSVGLTTTPEGATQGVVFNPVKGDFETRTLPVGVTDIRPKVTQPIKPTKTASDKGLTANQQSNLRLRGGKSLVDINQYTDPETGVVDWNLYSTEVGKAEGNALHANNLIKNARSSNKTTLDEKNFQVYGNRMAQANADFEKLTQTGFDPTSIGSEGLLGGWLPNLLKPVERQQYEQAERNFINSALRRESGAVITDDEFANARKQYFPQPGDGEPVLVQKGANRKLVVDEFRRLGGQFDSTGGTSQAEATSTTTPALVERKKGESTADYLKRKYNR